MAFRQRGGGSGGGGSGIEVVSRLPDPKKSRIVYVKADYYESGLPSEEETTFTFLPIRLGNGNLGNVINEFQDPRSDVNGWLIYDSNRFVYSELADEFGVLAAAQASLELEVDGTRYVLSGADQIGRIYSFETNDQITTAFAEGTEVTVRLITPANAAEADRRYLAPGGQFQELRSEDEAPIKENFYHVSPETGGWVEGLGLAEGGLPAVFLPEKGLLEADITNHNWRGVLFGLSREDSGSDWRLRTAAGVEPVQASLQIAGSGGGTLTVTLGDQVGGLDTSGEEGNAWSIRVGDTASAAVTAQHAGGAIRTIDVRIPAAGATLIQVRDALNGIAGVTAASAGGTNSFPRVNGAALDNFAFVGGLTGTELGAEHDVAAKTVTIEHLVSHTQQEIVEALNGLELDADTTLYAVLIGGSNPALGLVDPPLSRPFVNIFSRGSLPRPSTDEIDDRINTLVKPYALDGGPLISGTDADSAFLLEPEVTQAFLLGIIGITQAELNNIFLDARVQGTGAGRTIVVDQKDGSTITLAVPDTTGGGGGGTADGVINAAEFSADGMTLTLRTSTGGTITVNVPTALRQSGLPQGQVQALIEAYLTDYDTATEVAADIAQSLTNYRRLATVIENTGDVTLTPGDRGSTLRHTGNAAATYSPATADPAVGWWARLLNTSTAVLTFDVGVTRRIEGAGQSVEIAAGDCVTVQFLGSAVWAVITDTAGAAAAEASGGAPAERVVLAVSDQVIGSGTGSQEGASGVASQVLPADYTDFDNTGLIVYDPRNNTSTFINLRNDWLAAQTDANAPKLGASDQDEAGSRQWITWTPSTRTLGRGGQHLTDNAILRIVGVRLYDDGGAGGSGEVEDGSLTAAKMDTSTAAKQAEFRAAFMSAHISVRDNLPAIADANIGSDVVILRAGIADGISIVDITDPNTPITAAEVGDVLMALMFREAVWTRVGNIITGRGDATARAAIMELQLRYNYLAKRGGATLQLYHLGAGNEQYTQDEFVALAGQNLTITGHIDDPVLLPAAGRFFLRIPNGAGGHTIKTQGGAGASELEVFQLNATKRTMRNQLTPGTVQFTFQLTAPEMAAIFTDASSDPIDAAFVAFDVGMSESGSNEEDVLAVFYEHLVGSADGLTPEQAAEIQRDGQGVQTALAATRANAARLGAIEPRTTALEGKAWPGTVAVAPHELYPSIGAFTMRATLTRTTGTFPNGARMRIAAGARNGAFVHATEDKAAPASLAFDAAQSRALIQNTSNGWIGGTLYLDVYESDEATRIVRLPLYIPVVQGSVGPLITNIASYDATQDRFEDSTGGAVTLHPGSIVLTTQAIYDAAATDSFAFPANVIFLTR